MPKVSVIIPAYNHVKYVRQCVDSVLSQTYRDFEIVVVDDGSNDGTADILRQYKDKIKYVRQDNRGTQAARNAAIALSSGEYVALLDSDDAWLSHKLERQIAVLESQSEVALGYSLAYKIDSQGKHVGLVGRGVEGACAFSELLIEDFIPALTAVFRRSCLQKVGLFDETLLGAGDWDLWLRIAAKWPIVCVEEPLALYRVHLSNTTNMLFKTKRIYVEHVRVVEKALALANEKLPSGSRERVLARMHFFGAQVEARAGDALAAGTELGNALLLDPELFDKESLAAEIVQWAISIVGELAEPHDVCHTIREICASAKKLAPNVCKLERMSLSTYAMSCVFSGDYEDAPAVLRYLLRLGISTNLAWLRNRGVWSIAFDAFLGRKTADKLVWWVKRLFSVRKSDGNET